MKKLIFIFSLMLIGVLSQAQVLPGVVAAASEYGPEIIVDGDFPNDDDWSLSGGWIIGSGVASFDDATSGNLIQYNASQPIDIVGSTIYKLEFDITSAGTGNIRFANDDGSIEYIAYAQYADGEDHILEFTTPADVGTGGFYMRATTASTASFDIDNVSVREKR